MNRCTITLNQIRAKSPCKEGWETLLKSKGKTQGDDKPFPITDILDSNGIQDAVWCLRCLAPEWDRAIRLFACDCAEHVLHVYESKYPSDSRSRNAIKVARRFANGEATKEELRAAAAAARAAARAAAALEAAWAAARAAAWAADADAAWAAAAALAAAWDAAWAAAGSYQSDLFRRYFG